MVRLQKRNRSSKKFDRLVRALLAGQLFLYMTGVPAYAAADVKETKEVVSSKSVWTPVETADTVPVNPPAKGRKIAWLTSPEKDANDSLAKDKKDVKVSKSVWTPVEQPQAGFVKESTLAKESSVKSIASKLSWSALKEKTVGAPDKEPKEAKKEIPGKSVWTPVDQEAASEPVSTRINAASSADGPVLRGMDENKPAGGTAAGWGGAPTTAKPTSVTQVVPTTTASPAVTKAAPVAVAPSATTTATPEPKEISARNTADSDDLPGQAARKIGYAGFAASNDSTELAFLQEGFVEANVGDADVIVVDNDELQEIEETIAYEELPTDEGKTCIKSGAQFPIVMSSQISSKTAKKGDIIQGRLKYDLEIGKKLVAKKGDMVRGHVNYQMPARSVMHSLVSPNRWYRNSGVLGFSFDEIVAYNGEHVALNAKPARKSRIVKNKAEGRLLGVNHNGEITGPWGQQLRYKAIRIGLNAALAPAGVFSFGAMPVALGVIGAMNPSFAFMRPVGTNVPHRRLKGFCWGFLSGIPGSWIIEDTVTKGQECIIKPGDEFLVELQQKFTGEAVTSASLLPGSGANVQGQVVGSTDNKVKGKKKSSTKTPVKPKG